MLSKARIKLIQSLQNKKQRNIQQLFVIEGKKLVSELLQSSFHTATLFATSEFLSQHAQDIKNYTEIITVTQTELEKVSLQQAPQEALALAHLPNKQFVLTDNSLTILLDGIQDPGNLGTIMRTADWYGITQIVCSPDCVDAFNPKTIQASMGSFLRVDVFYQNLDSVILKCKRPVYGALMQGESIHQTTLKNEAFLIIGNEGKGISSNLLPYITNPITIPKFGQAESLNAAVATAIICDSWARG